MSYTSTSLDGLILSPKDGNGTGTVDVSGVLRADVIYAPGTIVRMEHIRQLPNNTFINNICSFVPLKINSPSTIVCEAYFNYYNFDVGNDSWTVTLSGLNEPVSNTNAKDSCDIFSYAYGGGGGRRSGRPLIITKDILENTNDTFSVSLVSSSSPSNHIISADSQFTFIFFQIAK